MTENKKKTLMMFYSQFAGIFFAEVLGKLMSMGYPFYLIMFLSVLLQAVQMFIARFCDLLEVEVNCDGCSVTLPGRRYRCLQCTDMMFVSV